DDDFCRRRDRENFGQRRQPLGRSVRIGRQPEIEDRHRDGLAPDELDRFLARSGGKYLMVRKSPAQLAQKPGVIVDDQQRFWIGRHVVQVTAEELAGSLSETRGRITRIVVPNPFSEITSRSPPAMRISSRVWNAPIP